MSSALPLDAASSTTRLELRPYQTEAIAAIEVREAEGVSRQLVVLPTGTGKTVVFSTHAARRGGDTLILAHRDELIRQAVGKVQTTWPGAPVGIVKGRENGVDSQVVVASVQTVAGTRRLAQLARRQFSVVHVDEAHHAAAPSYRRVLAALGCGPDDREDGHRPLLVGWTATADRGDGVGLRDVFQEIVYQRDMLWAIESGYLADLRGVRVRLNVDLSKVKVNRGDYADGELGHVLEAANAHEIAAKAYLEHAAGRKALIFTPTVELARLTAEAFEKVGVPSAYVHGEQAMDGPGGRRDVLERLKSGELLAVANCGVLTEGFDEPSIDCVVLARPTKSRGLYVQMLGRGTRRHPGKSHCLVLDLADASREHDLISLPSLFGLPADKLDDGAAGVAAVARAFAHDLAEQQQAAAIVAEEVDLWAAKISDVPLAWARGEGGRWVLSTEAGFVALEPIGDDRWRCVKKPRRGQFVTLIEGVDEQTAMGVGEDYVRHYTVRAARRAGKDPRTQTGLIRADAEWRRRKPSAKQLAYASRARVNVAGLDTAGEVSDAITAAKASKALLRRQA